MMINIITTIIKTIVIIITTTITLTYQHYVCFIYQEWNICKQYVVCTSLMLERGKPPTMPRGIGVVQSTNPRLKIKSGKKVFKL